jgi:anti-anti-sigma factor
MPGMTRLMVPVLIPPREITDDSLGGFEETLRPHAEAEGPGIVLDLAEVAFINSTGLGSLVKLGMRLDQQRRRLALARPGRRVERTLRLIGLDAKLPVFRSVEEAQAFVQQQGLDRTG